MTIVEGDINDRVFTGLDSTQKTNYLATGNLHFATLCTRYGITNASIATPTPYTPKRIGVICVLLAVVKDKIGSDWKEIANGISVDPNKVRLDMLEKELNTLLESFNPTNCGYEDDDPSDDSTGGICTTFARR